MSTPLAASCYTEWRYNDALVSWTFGGVPATWRGRNGEAMRFALEVPTASPSYGRAKDFILTGVWPDESVEGVF